MKRDSLQAWFPVLLRYGGFAIFLFFVCFWVFTGRVEPTLLAGAGTMMGLGEGAAAIRDFANTRPPVTPPPPQQNGESP
jgi:hypothetical protein